MQIEQLRIGNCIKVDDMPIEQVTIDTFVALKQYPHHLGLFYPIQITEDWLLKFGFLKTTMKMSGCYVYQHGIYRLLKSYCDEEQDYGLCIEDVSPPTLIIASIKYVHELQNLYFALTGNELKLQQ